MEGEGLSLENNKHAVEAQSIMAGIGWPVSDSAEVVRAIGALVSAQLAVALETRLLAEETRLAAKRSALGLGLGNPTTLW
jgi:hypothetical protein